MQVIFKGRSWCKCGSINSRSGTNLAIGVFGRGRPRTKMIASAAISSATQALILTGSACSCSGPPNLIVALAAQHKLPAVYYQGYFVTSGGLISYGWHVDDQYVPRRSA